MLHPKWSPPTALEYIREAGLEDAILVVRGRPMVNENFFRNNLLHTLGFKIAPHFFVQPKSINYQRLVSAIRGKRSLVLVEATEYRRRITAADVFDELHESCLNEGFTPNEWGLILPVLIVHRPWSYKMQIADSLPRLRPLKNGVELALHEAQAVNAMAVCVDQTSRQIELKAAFRSFVEKGGLAPSCTLPTHTTSVLTEEYVLTEDQTPGQY